MESFKSDILLKSDSSVLTRAVNESLYGLGVNICAHDSDTIRLNLIHLQQAHHLATFQANQHQDRPVVLLVDPQVDVTQVLENDGAVAVLEVPFRSNELRVTIGRILRLRVADVEIYDRADRPVPTVTKTMDVTETELEVTVPPQSMDLPTKRTLRTDELPPIETFTDLPKVSVEKSMPPPPLPPAATSADAVHASIDESIISSMSAEYIEKVVWEVVPKLAERILREEIARLLEEKSN